MSDDLRGHYRKLFDQHGDAAQAVQHRDAASQHNRFRVLTEFADDLGSVVDVGCGLGHLYDYLRGTGFQGTYLGLDFVAEFVAQARHRHAASASASARFELFDMRADRYPEGRDTFVICGVFNNRAPDAEAFMQATLRGAFAAARRGIAFSAMSTYVDYQDETLAYFDPRAVFDFCKTSLSRRVTLRHDYLVREDRPPYEFTIYVYK